MEFRPTSSSPPKGTKRRGTMPVISSSFFRLACSLLSRRGAPRPALVSSPRGEAAGRRGERGEGETGEVGRFETAGGSMRLTAGGLIRGRAGAVVSGICVFLIMCFIILFLFYCNNLYFDFKIVTLDCMLALTPMPCRGRDSNSHSLATVRP